jgi:hypothetical protein
MLGKRKTVAIAALALALTANAGARNIALPEADLPDVFFRVESDAPALRFAVSFDDDTFDFIGVAAVGAGLLETALKEAEASVQAAQDRVDQLSTALDAIRASGRPVLSQEDIKALEVQLQAAKNDLAIATQQREFARQMVTLNRVVDVELRNADVRQAALALARTSGIDIRVGEGVPKEVRLTVEARRVPLASVLEAVARQANLMIAPDANGVALARWPELKAQGGAVTVTGRNAPWSDDWAAIPTQFLSGAKAPSIWTPSGLPAPPGLPNARPVGVEGVNVTSVGGNLVLVERGTNGGKQGLWITTYRMENGRRVQADRWFHETADSSGESSSRRPGALPKPNRPPGR